MPDGTPTLSVVIPCRNDALYLDACLTALERQSRPVDEVIVVDNESSDGSPDVGRRHGAHVLEQTHPGIWPTAAAGFDAAKGTLIGRLDADSLPGPTWAERAAATFETPDAPDLLVGDGDFYGPRPWANWVGDHLYIGAMWTFVTPYLGHRPVFGSNFVMTARAWRELRLIAHTSQPDIHDDLDLSFAIRPWMSVRYRDDWRVGISNRPFDTWRGLGRRLRWVATTMRANGVEARPFHHRWERRRWRRRHPLDVSEP